MAYNPPKVLYVCALDDRLAASFFKHFPREALVLIAPFQASKKIVHLPHGTQLVTLLGRVPITIGSTRGGATRPLENLFLPPRRPLDWLAVEWVKLFVRCSTPNQIGRGSGARYRSKRLSFPRIGLFEIMRLKPLFVCKTHAAASNWSTSSELFIDALAKSTCFSDACPIERLFPLSFSPLAIQIAARK